MTLQRALSLKGEERGEAGEIRDKGKYLEKGMRDFLADGFWSWENLGRRASWML